MRCKPVYLAMLLAATFISSASAADKIPLVEAWRVQVDYEGNSIAADKKYQDKEIAVKGTVNEIGKRDGRPFIRLDAGVRHWAIFCWFDKKDADALANIAAGSEVTVTSIGDGAKTIGENTAIGFRDCKLH